MIRFTNFVKKHGMRCVSEKPDLSHSSYTSLITKELDHIRATCFLHPLLEFNNMCIKYGLIQRDVKHESIAVVVVYR